MLTELAAKRIDVAPANLIVAIPLIKSGRVRALAVMSNTRTNLLPGLKTIAEQGIPDYDYASWRGYIAPATTPSAIVSRLSEGFAKVAKSTAHIQMPNQGGLRVRPFCGTLFVSCRLPALWQGRRVHALAPTTPLSPETPRCPRPA